MPHSVFSLTPDPARYVTSATHEASLNVLQKGLRQAGGVLVLLGEPGTGKTLLTRKLLSESVTDEVIVAQLLGSSLEVRNLLPMLLGAFGLGWRGMGRAVQQEKLEQFLAGLQDSGRSALLVVDDAHAAHAMKEER